MKRNIKCWKQNAQFALDNIKKNDYIRVKGKVHYHEFTTPEGKKGRNAEVIATSVIKLNRDRADEN